MIRECISGEVLLARSLLSGTARDLAPLLREVASAVGVPVAGVISDGQTSIRRAVEQALPGVPHQLCQFHYADFFIYYAGYSIPHVSWDIRSYMRGGGLDAWILFDRLTRTRAGGG